MDGYDPQAFPAVAVTVDLVVLTVRADRLHVLVVRRGEEPFAGREALPGGFVRPDEDLLAAASRELAEETGLRPGAAHLEQLASYGAPHRDPRMRVVTVAHLALVAAPPEPRAGSDAAATRWAPVEEVSPGLAFDHDVVLADGVARARGKLEYTSLAASLCGPSFTVAELRRVYEAVWGRPLDPRNFHRKVTSATGFLEPTGETTTRDGGRPAQLYRRGPATALHPPLLRAEN
ncbi:NUDIX hydrolase [Blastococcus sp. SYSU D00813]